MKDNRHLVFCLAFPLTVLIIFPLIYHSIKYTVENFDNGPFIFMSGFATFSGGIIITVGIFYFSDKLLSWMLRKRNNNDKIK